MGNPLNLPAHWKRPLLALVLLLAATLVLYRHTAMGMVSIWSASDTYAHGFIVPLLSLWLVWRARHAVAPLQPRPAPLAWLLMLGVAAAWLAGDLVAVNAVTHLALVTLVVLSVPAVLGWQVAFALAFPLGFLFFAVPIGDFMLPRLMEWTADFTVYALRLSGIPVYREGLQFVIPSGSWSVVEACSGIRYLIASVTVGCLFAYLSYRSTRKRLLFVGVAILVPLLANWLRAYMIVMIGHLSGNELATGVDHLVYGWVFFGVVILIMLFIGARWADAPEPPSAGSVGVSSFSMSTSARRGLPSSGAALVVLGIVLLPHLAERVFALGTQSGPVALQVPAAVAPWQQEAAPPSSWVPAFQAAVASSHTGYRAPDGRVVGLHLSYYRNQDYERKLVTSSNVLVTSDDKNWVRTVSGQARTAMGGQPLDVSTATLRGAFIGQSHGAQRLQVWQFYWVNGGFTASDVKAKLQGALGRASGKGDDGAILVIYTPMDPALPEGEGRAAATATLQAFLQAQGTSIEAALRQSQGAD